MIERGDHRWPITRHLFKLEGNLNLLVSRTGAAAGTSVWDVLFLAKSGGDSGIRTPDLRIMMKIAPIFPNEINGL